MHGTIDHMNRRPDQKTKKTSIGDISEQKSIIYNGIKRSYERRMY